MRIAVHIVASLLLSFACGTTANADAQSASETLTTGHAEARPGSDERVPSECPRDDEDEPLERPESELEPEFEIDDFMLHPHGIEGESLQGPDAACRRFRRGRELRGVLDALERPPRL